VIATPALAQKGPSAAPGSEPDPVRGVTLDEFSETGSNTLTLGGITARIEAQANNDDTTTPVFVIQDASGEVLRFEGEPSFFSFLPASMRLANIDPSTPRAGVDCIQLYRRRALLRPRSDRRAIARWHVAGARAWLV
jgi:hypothetical protein